jgi:hypothetical protein
MAEGQTIDLTKLGLEQLNVLKQNLEEVLDSQEILILIVYIRRKFKFWVALYNN